MTKPPQPIDEVELGERINTLADDFIGKFDGTNGRFIALFKEQVAMLIAQAITATLKRVPDEFATVQGNQLPDYFKANGIFDTLDFTDIEAMNRKNLKQAITNELSKFQEAE